MERHGSQRGEHTQSGRLQTLVEKFVRRANVTNSTPDEVWPPNLDEEERREIPAWRTASGITVSALSVLPIGFSGNPPQLTEAQERARQQDIDIAIAAGHVELPAGDKTPELSS